MRKMSSHTEPSSSRASSPSWAMLFDIEVTVGEDNTPEHFTGEFCTSELYSDEYGTLKSKPSNNKG